MTTILFSAGRRAGLLLCATFLAGCATVGPPPVTVPTGAAPTFHPAIELEGRLSATYQQKGNDESVSIKFRWQQEGQRIRVTLNTPLDSTVATIEVGPNEARLVEAGKPPRTAPDIDSLSTATFGWTLPVNGLQAWLQGFSTESGTPQAIAVPGQPDGKPVVTRDGWQLQYVSWQKEEATGEVRPKRIDLQRYTPQLGQMSIRLVLDSWQPAQAH